MIKLTMPKGFRSMVGTDHRPRVAVIFDEELFEKICTLALKEQKGFSQMVGELCRCGLLDLEESDRLEEVES